MDGGGTDGGAASCEGLLPKVETPNPEPPVGPIETGAGGI